MGFNSLLMNHIYKLKAKQQLFFYVASAVVHLRYQIDEPKGCPDSWKKSVCACTREGIGDQKRLLESVYRGRETDPP